MSRTSYPAQTSPFEYYKMAFARFAEFSGRSRRSEYWYFFLFNLLVSMALGIASMVFGLAAGDGSVGVLDSLYALIAFVPGLAVAVRRLHDTGRSGWWLLIVLLPLIGIITLIVFLASDGEPGRNKWGQNPKEAPADEVGDHLIL